MEPSRSNDEENLVKDESSSKYSEDSILLSENQRSELSRITKPRFGPSTWRLLYRLSRDGEQASDFHSKCDDVDPTLVIVKSKRNCVFGGYCPVKWNISLGAFYEAQGAYIFGFEKDRKSSITKIEYVGSVEEDRILGSIWCGHYTGPFFQSMSSGDGFGIFNDGTGWTVLFENGGYGVPEGKSTHFLNDGFRSFKVFDYEVFTPREINPMIQKDLETRVEFLLNEREDFMEDLGTKFCALSVSLRNISITGIPKLLFSC